MTAIIFLVLFVAIALASWRGSDSRDLSPTESPHTYPGLPDRSSK